MRYPALLVFAAAILTNAAPQDSCKHGLAYCGQGLLRKGAHHIHPQSPIQSNLTVYQATTIATLSTH
ncbi:MAG: hypothetical protein CL912_13630 [Deltaproteobacteria bacterium]|nr:hypothetical protein [Deltaproteobacteria bacterium]